MKKVIFKRNLKAIPRLLKKAYSLLIPISKVIFSWKTQKKKPFKTAKYATILFKHFIDGSYFYLFQTIEMNDFINGLHPSNIDLLIEEKGICIAHTYFSLPIEYHKGRLFTNDNQINQVVAANFNYLSKKIKDGAIWNPTINELVNFIANFESVLVDVDENGEIFVATPTILDYRTVH
ncbi:hypothetical protein [Flavobacterium sp.]|uniref:hypothetical protein n=1 Tax=Flavobacterium sp. TaxID=239 RepID=UPI0025D7EA20|nr:hypothetical protein [Flavobacterium sp.]